MSAKGNAMKIRILVKAGILDHIRIWMFGIQKEIRLASGFHAKNSVSVICRKRLQGMMIVVIDSSFINFMRVPQLSFFSTNTR